MDTSFMSNAVPTATKSTSTLDNTGINTSFSLPEQKSKSQNTGNLVMIRDDPSILSPYLRFLNSLVYWENSLLSGLVFGGSILSITLSHFFLASVLSIICGTLFVITLLNFIYVGSSRFIQSLSGSVVHNPNSDRIQNAYFECTEQNAVHVATTVLTALNSVARPLARLVFVQDFASTAKALIVLYVAWSVFNYIPTTYVLILHVCAFFSVPLVYRHNKEQIHSLKTFMDAKVHKYFVQACTFTNKLRTLLFEKVKQSKSSLTPSPTKVKKEE